MAVKETSSDQQTTRSGQAVMTTFNGQKKKMKNSPVYKTVLAPNAPWPKPEEIPVLKPKSSWRKVQIACENDNLNEFLQSYEESNKSKIATKSRVRDKLSGRFKSS